MSHTLELPLPRKREKTVYWFPCVSSLYTGKPVQSYMLLPIRALSGLNITF